MAVPTRVLENGQWVTRLLDPYQILVQNRDHQKSKASNSVEPSETPTRALLTQTLVRSPLIRSIHTAKIRHSTKNDVVLVCDDNVLVKEAFPDYNMSTILTKSDFDSRIRNATVCYNMESSLVPGKFSEIDDLKIEVEEDAAIASFSQSAKSAKESFSPHLSPQILVLVLESFKVVFMYGTSGPAQRPQFFQSQKHLPYYCRRAHQLGEHVAVDPRSRALVIAAQEKYFYLYSLKAATTLAQELDQAETIMPVEAERLFAVEGIILHCIFLQPELNDQDHVILLLVVSKDGDSRLVWYEWDTKIKLSDAPIAPKSFLLPKEHFLPLLLVPLQAFNAFLLVNKSQASVYRDILTGTPSSLTINLIKDDHDTLTEHSESKNSPLWVSWARPVRDRTGKGESFSAKDDNIYLCREDGLLKFIDIKHVRTRMIDSAHNAGQLHTSIDGGFAVVDLGPNHDDMLVACGESGMAGTWRLSARQTAEPVSVPLGWTPMTDCTLVPSSRYRHVQGLLGANMPTKNLLPNDRRILVAAKHGSISELRCGCQARAVDSIDLRDVISNIVLDIFVLFPAENVMLVLISHPTTSSLLRLQVDQEPELLEELKGILLDSKTIAMSVSASAIVCQVTTQAIICSSSVGVVQDAVLWQRDFGSSGKEILTASFDADYRSKFLAYAVERDEACWIEILSIDDALSPLSGPIQASRWTTGLAMYMSENQKIVAVSNSQGTLEVFVSLANESRQGFDRAAEWSFVDFGTICDSIAIFVVDEEDTSDTFLIVCGLRNGQVHTLQLEGQSWTLKSVEQIAVGNTTVMLKKAKFPERGALILCDNDLYALVFPRPWTNSRQSMLRLLSVDNAHVTNTSEFLPLAFTQLAEESKIPQAFSLVVASSTELVFAREENIEKGLVSRRWDMDGTPACILYSDHLDKLIVLSSAFHIDRPAQRHRARQPTSKRIRRTFLTFLDLDQRSLEQEDREDEMKVDQASTLGTGNSRQILYCRIGEKILGMVEWYPIIDGSKFHLLLFHTRIKDRKRPATGRLLFYAVARSGLNDVEVTLKKTVDFASPVFSVTPHPDGSSIVYCNGTDLSVMKLDPSPSAIKFGVPCKTSMRSPAMRLSVVGDFIYVSTASESLQVYQYVNNQLRHWDGDAIARNGINHTLHLGSNLILASDKNGNLTGLWQPTKEHANNTAVTVFDATMPRATTRFIPLNQPTYKQDVLIPGRGIFLGGNDTNISSRVQSAREGSTGHHLPDYRSNVLLGLSTDGAIVQLQVMKDGWRLLKQIQTMCEQDPDICPLGPKRQRSHVGPYSDNPRFLHINGDILKRLLSRDAVCTLQRILGIQNPVANIDKGWTCDARLSSEAQMLIELSRETFGVDFVDSRSRHDLLCEIVRWVFYVMRTIVI